MGRYTTALSAQDLNKLRVSFANVRKELGLDYDIMVHCHNEYDLATARRWPAPWKRFSRSGSKIRFRRSSQIAGWL